MKKKAKAKKKKKVKRKAALPAVINVEDKALVTWGQKRTDLLRKTICAGATDTELDFFMELCKSTNLNPFLKEIWFIKTVDKKTNEPKLLIMAARDGYLQIANRHVMFDGMESGVVYKDGKILYGWAKVHRKDRSHAAYFQAIFKEYNRDWHKAWKQTPSAMIVKVAEANALKRAFSITGLALAEEIGTYVPKDEITYDSRENGERNITPRGVDPDKPLGQKTADQKPEGPTPRETKLKIMLGTWGQLVKMKPEAYTDKQLQDFYGEQGATEGSELTIPMIDNLTRQFNTDLAELLNGGDAK